MSIQPIEMTLVPDQLFTSIGVFIYGVLCAPSRRGVQMILFRDIGTTCKHVTCSVVIVIDKSLAQHFRFETIT